MTVMTRIVVMIINLVKTCCLAYVTCGQISLSDVTGCNLYSLAVQ